MQERTCRKCTEEINEEAIKCPHCGYEPRKIGHTARVVYALVGLALTLTIAGAIIGIPLLCLSYYAHTKTQDRKPTTYSPA